MNSHSVPHTRFFVALFLALCLVRIWTTPLFAGGSGANVAVIVNADSWASMTIANEYIALRDIPPVNVVYLRNVPGFETTSINNFREKILDPALLTLEQRGLGSQIDYLVYSADFPYGANVSADIGQTRVPQYVTKFGSLTGLTFLCQLVRAESLAYLDVNSNRYFRAADTVNAGAEFANDEEAVQKTTTAIELANQGKHSQALEIFQGLAKQYPQSVLTAYNLACCEANLDHPAQAIKHLEKAIALGWWNVQHTQSDPDLASLRDRADFKRLIAKMESQVINVAETRGFRTMYSWDENYEPSTTRQGPRYLISSMLAATSGRGMSVNEALNALRRAKSADGTKPNGTVYFMNNDNVRAKTREWAFESAVSLLKDEGVAAKIISNGKILPHDKQPVAGLMAGYAAFSLHKWENPVLPGAFCEHLTSYGGVLAQGANQMPITKWMAAGAAGTAGAVTEPYALQWKFPTPFVHVHYARGCTLGEAYYQSVQMPYQLLLMGDPLCAPWATPPEFEVTGLDNGQTVKGRVTIAPKAKTGSEISQFEVYVDGRRVKFIKNSDVYELDTSRLPDGYHEARVIAVEDTKIETRAVQTIPFTVSNRDRAVKLTTNQAGAAFGDMLQFEVAAKGADKVVLAHNGRALAELKAQGDKVEGTIEIPSNMLGLGEVQILALATYENNDQQRAISKPVKVTLYPPKAMLGVAKPRGELFEGIKITNAKSKSSNIAGLNAKEWQKTAAVGDGAFTIEAFLNVPQDDLYQFQLRSDSKVQIQVDGQAMTRADGEGGDGQWKYAPLNLKRGWHKLLVKVAEKDGEDKPGGFDGRVDIRFGGQGTVQPERHILPYCEGVDAICRKTPLRHPHLVAHVQRLLDQGQQHVGIKRLAEKEVAAGRASLANNARAAQVTENNHGNAARGGVFSQLRANMHAIGVG